jgi:hypothetical protein
VAALKLKINENSNVTMTFNDFRDKLVEIYHSKFPNSLCSVRLYKVLGRSIVIDCFLANNKSELSGGYWENDMFKICFWIHDLPNDFEMTDTLPETMVLTNHNSHVLIKPQSKYLAYDSVKIPFRKTTGNANKIIATFKKYVDKLYDIVNQQIAEDNIHSSFINIVNDKI